MSSMDPVRRFLGQRGSAEHVVAAGIEGLVADWEETVAQIEAGYVLGLDDYLNDMDGRQLLAEALPLAPAAERLHAQARVSQADARVRAHLRPLRECLWGERVAATEGWRPDTNWWYFTAPEAPGPGLQGELKKRH